MDERDHVLAVECVERGVKTLRHVRPTELSLERLKFIWEKIKDFDVLFNDYTQKSFDGFANAMIGVGPDGELQASALMWDVDDVGIFRLSNIRAGHSASAHFLFWDGPRHFKGRVELCREMLKYVFEKYGFQKIEAQVPLYAKGAMIGVEAIGFIQEGRLRREILYKGEWFDVNVYSLLAHEIDEIPEQNLSTWRNKRLACWGCGKTYMQKFGGGS